MSVIKLFITIIFAGLINAAYGVNLDDGLHIPLVDEEGQHSSIAHYDGHYRLVFFGYTYCPDICPLTLLQVGRALKSLDGITDNLVPLFISIDPNRDVPEKLKHYTDAFHPDLIGLSGQYDDLLELNKQFRTTFGFTALVEGKEQSINRDQYLSLTPTDGYVPYHSSQIYLLDREGRLLDIIGYGSQSNQIADKIREYITP